eukprot:gene8703-8884_t
MASNIDYGSTKHWDAHEGPDTALEWYADYDTIRPLLHKHLQYGDSILVLGPGASMLHDEMYESGYRSITCTDFSGKVLAACRQRAAAAGRNSINFQLADIVAGLPYEHYPYNAIIDKGTIDCILCRSGGEHDAQQALVHIFDNVKSSGVLLMFSHSPPTSRLPLLQKLKWDSIQLIDGAELPSCTVGSVIKHGFYPTCAEALQNIPGYTHTLAAMKNCPSLMAMQTDPTVVKTFFVPSNTAIENISKYIGLPVNMVIGPMLSGVMCQFLQYHIADKKNTLTTWKVGSTFSTAYPGAKLTVEEVTTPRIKTKQGTVATVERVVTCGASVAFGVDTVLAPFEVPRLG